MGGWAACSALSPQLLGQAPPSLPPSLRSLLLSSAPLASQWFWPVSHKRDQWRWRCRRSSSCLARPAPLSLVRGISSTGARVLVSGGAHTSVVKAAFTRPQAGPLLGGGRGRQEPQEWWSWVCGSWLGSDCALSSCGWEAWEPPAVSSEVWPEAQAPACLGLSWAVPKRGLACTRVCEHPGLSLTSL